ncbi:hypothetical protein [Streptomyces sp. NBC_01314]|uniref:hypothetical protein n=1 Tax=Streptomyces sp. NBC_01314 TaxID=2903821 RepID=UPI00308FDF6F|nr:hypothetical protein OG622_33645 [Streptomyces sp. NBC_01314]
MKRKSVGLLAAGLMLTGTGAAPVGQQGGIPVLRSGGAEFTEGAYTFNPPGTDHGSFEWSGRLTDTYPNDGHTVYVQVSVERHGWARYYGKQRGSVWMRHSDWSGARRYTDDAAIRVCRDRGSARPDNCSPVQEFSYSRD